MYEVTVKNNEENRQALEELGLSCRHITFAPEFLGIQLNTRSVVGRAWASYWDSPLIRMKYLAPLLLLQTTFARIDYMYSEFLINKDTYNLMVDFAEQVHGVKHPGRQE